MASFGIKNCTTCGQVFSGPLDICKACEKQEDKAFELVYAYLREYPDATIAEVGTVTEVSEELILKFVKQGKIKATNIEAKASGSCIRCGKEIQRGHYCATCLSMLRKETGKVTETLKKNQTVQNSVHSFDNRVDK